MSASLRAFVRLSRPHFLLGGVLLFGLGAATTGPLEPATYLFGQLMVTSAQVTAHFVNEYADLEADRAVGNRTFFSGGSGVLVAGELPASVAIRAAWVSSGVALATALLLGLARPGAALCGLVALSVSWAYSIPPVRLLGTGWGEVVTSLVVVGLVPLTGSLVQGGRAAPALWWSIAVLVPVHTAMLLAFEVPDLESDAASGKRVLAVRIGPARTRRLVVSLLALAALTALSGHAAGYLPGTWWALGIVPAAATTWAMHTQRHAALTTAAVTTLAATAAGLLAGFLAG